MAQSRLEFPSKFAKESGKWMLFTRYKYSRPDKNTPPTENRVGNIIALPIPANLTSNYSANWENIELGIFGKNVSAGVSSIINGVKNSGSYVDGALAGQGFNGVVDSIKALAIDKIKSGEIVSTAEGLGADYATDALTKGSYFENAGVYSGLARNPFNAVLYNGPNFRTFTFDWRLIPKNKDEAESIKAIIKEFKIAMHAYFDKVFQDNLFEYPDIFSIQMANSEHTFKMAQCALKDVNVSYPTDGGTAKYFEGGRPFSVQLSLQFQELTMLMRKDVEEDGY